MKKAIITALIAALALCSCGSGGQPDIKKDYKKYLDYAFDGKYSIGKVSEQMSEEGVEERVWQITFTDAYGEEQTDEIRIDDLEGDDEEFIKSEYDWTVLNFVSTKLSHAVRRELRDKLVAEHFELTDQDDSGGSGDGFSIYFELTDCSLIEPDDAVLAERLNTEHGVKYAGTGLKEWSRDEANALQISIVLEDSSRVDEFSEKLTALGEAFVEYTESPKNYCFELYAKDGNGDVQLQAAGCKVMGVETDATLFGAEYVRQRMGGGAQPASEDQMM